MIGTIKPAQGLPLRWINRLARMPDRMPPTMPPITAGGPTRAPIFASATLCERNRKVGAQTGRQASIMFDVPYPSASQPMPGTARILRIALTMPPSADCCESTMRGVGRIVTAINKTSARPALPNISNIVRQPNLAARTPARIEPTMTPMPVLAWKIDTDRGSFGPG